MLLLTICLRSPDVLRVSTNIIIIFTVHHVSAFQKVFIYSTVSRSVWLATNSLPPQLSEIHPNHISRGMFLLQENCCLLHY